MSDNSTAVSPSNLTSPSNITSLSPTGFFEINGGWLFYLVSGLIDHILGIPANGWSLYVIITSGGRRMSLVESEIITLNLVALEIVNSLNFILGMINLCFIKSGYMFTWLGVPYGFILSGRSLFQCLICLERYLAVLHPVVFLRYKPLRYKLACCGLIWLLVVAFTGTNILLLTFQGQPFILVLAMFITILSIDLFCSLSILRVLRQPGLGEGGREKKDGGKAKDREEDRGRERVREENDSRMEEEKAGAGERGKVKWERAVERGKERVKEEGKNRQKRRAFRLVSFMMGMLVFNNVIIIIYVLLQKVFGPQVFQNDILPYVVSLSLMGSCVQALLHLHRAGRLPCLTPNTRGRQQNN